MIKFKVKTINNNYNYNNFNNKVNIKTTNKINIKTTNKINIKTTNKINIKTNNKNNYFNAKIQNFNLLNK